MKLQEKLEAIHARGHSPNQRERRARVWRPRACDGHTVRPRGPESRFNLLRHRVALCYPCPSPRAVTTAAANSSASPTVDTMLCTRLPRCPFLVSRRRGTGPAREIGLRVILVRPSVCKQVTSKER